jgi:hypothetical protein
MDVTRNQLPEWLAPALHEYDGLRAEVTASMQTMQSSLAFGVASIGLVAAGAFELAGSGATAVSVFMLAIPLISGVAIVIWFGEFARMMRAGRHLCLLEGVFRSAIAAPAPVFAWETKLHDPARHWYDRQHCIAYYGVVIAFSALALAAVGFAVFELDARGPWVPVAIGEGTAILLGAALVTHWVRESAGASDDCSARAAPLASGRERVFEPQRRL